MKRRLVATVVAAIFAATTAFTSAIAVAQDIPSVSVRPDNTSGEDPNEGRWFVLEAGPGGNASASALVTNVAEVDQRVRFAVRDLIFDADGNPHVMDDAQIDLGAWGRVAESEVVIPAGATRNIRFTISVPQDAEPGDHVGAFVATTSNVQGDFNVVRRIATRIYLTVPGEARRSFEIEDVRSELDSTLWPTTTAITVALRNTGRVRLRPTVEVAGVPATGADLLMSRAVEHYSVVRPVPWYGGVVRTPIQATTEGGLSKTINASRFVIPWGLIVLVVVAASAMYAGRRWWKNRKSPTAELKQDIQRLEQLITQQAKAQESTAAVGAGLGTADDVPDDEEAIILAALKRARRSSDDTALARIALAKHMTSGEGLDLILEALQSHSGKHREALLGAAVSYGADALSTHERFHQLPDDVQTELGERLVTVDTPSGNGHGNGKPAKVPQPVVGQTDSDRLRTELAKVKGVGPAKQEALVSRFGSLEAIREAEVEDLTDVSGIGYATAREILDQLKG